MTAILSWLLGSRTGIGVVIGLLVLALTAVVAARFFAVGRAKEQAAAAQATLQIILKKVATDDTINRMSASQRRDYVRRWLRKD